MDKTSRYLKCIDLYQKDFSEYWLCEVLTNCNCNDFKSEKLPEQTYIYYHELNILVIVGAVYGDAAFYTSEDEKFTLKLKLIIT